jgi:nucleoside permease NupC
MFLTGIMVFLGVMLILTKLPRRLMLKALHHDVIVDLLVSAITLALHWGPSAASWRRLWPGC